MDKKIYMIAGPNGAGKTTSALALLPELKICEFLNADEIARGIAPLDPESVPIAASKLLIKKFKELLALNESFAFETTASGKNYIKYLEEAREKGYTLHMMFLWLSSPELAIQRVAVRVKQGGHTIPEGVIRKRYGLGVKNFIIHYLRLADDALLVDNSIPGEQKLIASKNKYASLEIKEAGTWSEIERLAYV